MQILRNISVALGAVVLAASAHAAGGALHAHEPEDGWEFEGPVGELDMASVQRGYQVYHEVCSSCHSLNLLSYRNLGEPGGPYFDEDYPNANDNPQVKALAAQNEILDTVPNETGDYDYRPARTSDTFKAPYPNAQAARAANGGALPPDLSVITKARHGGASYVYSLLTGYPDPAAFEDRVVTEATDDAPAESERVLDISKVEALAHGEDHYEGELVQPLGQYYNPFMAGDTSAQWRGDPRHAPPGGFLAMPPQLTEGRVTYMDGTEATVHQMAEDVAHFLQWAGDPKQTARKSLGLGVLPYLLILAGLLWVSYHQIWRKIHH